MTLLEKMRALNALRAGLVKIGVNCNNKWYASGPERGGDGLLLGLMGVADSPEAAVNALWDQIIKLQDPFYVKIADGDRVRWNGFMWERV